MPQPNRDRDALRVGRITRNAVVANEVRGNREYLSATRNPHDVPAEAYTGTEKSPPPPPPGTQRRFEWDKKIGELRARGLSYVDIATEMNTTDQTVRTTCIRHGFVKGTGE